MSIKKIIYGRPQIYNNDKFTGLVACMDNVDGRAYLTYGKCGIKPRQYLSTDYYSLSINDPHFYAGGFSNASGDDNFALAVGSAGVKVEQLKQALRILGASITESDFGNQTRNSLVGLGYPPSINDEDTFNSIILSAYDVNKKLIKLTEPELRALYLKDVPVDNRDTLTFQKWLKRENIKLEVQQGAKAVADVLLGWLKLKYAGTGNTSGTSPQPVATSTGWFSRTDDGSIPTGYAVLGTVAIIGLFGIWGVSAVVKSRNLKIANS